MKLNKSKMKNNQLEGKVTETEYGVDKEDFNEIMPHVEPRLKDGDKVEITTTESIVDETLKLDLSNVISAMGIKYINRNEVEKAQIRAIVKDALGELKAKGLMDVIVKEDDEEDSSEVDSLYSGADDRGIEYGIKNEDFDTLMKELKESGRPSIKVNETINPKIKKSDLIKYIKNKNNVK